MSTHEALLLPLGKSKPEGNTPAVRGSRYAWLDRPASAPPSVDLLAALQIFGDAVLALGEYDAASLRQPVAQSLLQDLLPSLPSLLGELDLQADVLGKELEEWTEISQRLARHAAWHCRQHNERLIERLGRIEHHAEQLVDAVSALESLRTGADENRAQNSNSPPARLPLPSDATALSLLLKFCRAVHALVSVEPQQDALFQVFPSIHRMFGTLQPKSLARLRTDLIESHREAEGLLKLAALHCESAAEELKAGTERAQALAASLVDALEALHYCVLDRADICEVQSPQLAETSREGHRNAKGVIDSVDLPSISELADLQFRMGHRCHVRGFTVAAELFYSRAISLNGEHMPAYRGRGKLRLDAMRLEDAVADLTQALRMRGSDPPALRWRGDAYFRLRRYPEALEDFTQLLNQSPNDVDARLQRAATLSRLGDLGPAASELDRIARCGHRSARLHLERGLIWQARNQPRQAIAEFRAALRLTPGYQPARQALERLQSQEPFETARGELAVARNQVDRRSSSFDGLANDELLQPFLEDEELPAEASGRESDPRSEPVRGEKGADRGALVVESPRAEANGRLAGNTLPAIVSPSSDGARPAALKGGESPAVLCEDSIKFAKNGQIILECPNCGRQSSMYWKHMEKGKVFGCPECQQKLVVQQGGRFAKLMQDASGDWRIDDAPPLWRDRRFHFAVAAVLVLIVATSSVVAVAPWRQQQAAQVLVIPEGLEPRAAAFGEAWIAGDYQVIRAVTLPSQAGRLFAWLRSNPVPSNKDGISVEAKIAQKGPQSALVEIQLIEPLSAGLPSKKVMTRWHHERNQWLFNPSVATN